MTPIISYIANGLRVRHAMDLNTDMVHVYSRKDQEEEKEIFTFDNNCYMRDAEGKQLGKIYLIDDHWIFKDNEELEIIKGYTFKDVDGVLKTEAVVVAKKLGLLAEEVEAFNCRLRRL